jgi:glycerol-3-phosphate dehydrogenase (NAD(P)+)
MRCTVIGAGAWGTAIADLLALNGHETALWARESDVVASVNGEHVNRMFLDGVTLHPGVRASASQADALADAALVVYATPSAHLREIARAGAASVRRDAVLCVATKGIERETLALMTGVVESEVAGRDVVGISGPSFAAEVAARQPTAVVAASRSRTAAEFVQAALSNLHFRVYTNDDVIGVELGGALKNVMAVASGMVEGVGLGSNSRAALITRGLHEMSRLGLALGARAQTFAGLAGLGDLVLTCTGALSRNRALGYAVGQGASLEQALAGKHTVAEGVVTTQSTMALAAARNVEMPIVQTVHRILFEGHPARRAVGDLMARELRPEQDL